MDGFMKVGSIVNEAGVSTGFLPNHQNQLGSAVRIVVQSSWKGVVEGLSVDSTVIHWNSCTYAK